MQRIWTGLVFIATSVDGYIARSDGGLEWLTEPPAESRHTAGHRGDDAPPDYDKFTVEVSHLVMGRGTYDKVLTFDPWPYERFHVLVLSTTLPRDRDDRIRVVASLPEACSALTEEKATAVYVDGGQVISQFLADGLIDELTISRAPVLLGEGHPPVPHPPARDPADPPRYLDERHRDDQHPLSHQPLNSEAIDGSTGPATTRPAAGSAIGMVPILRAPWSAPRLRPSPEGDSEQQESQTA